MNRFGRRQWLGGAASLLGLCAADVLWPSLSFAADADERRKSAKAQRCILIWLNGGPSQIDTFDPKPGTVNGGPFRAIKTRAPKIQISEHLPRLAEVGDRFSLVRNMSTKEGNHIRAQHLLHTGYAPNPTVQHPSLGGWVSARLGDPNSELPAFVSLAGPSFDAGFLGVQHGPMIVRTPGTMPSHIDLAAGVDGDRFDRRRAALSELERSFATQTGDAKIDGRAKVYAKAVRLMKTPRSGAFDIADEPSAVRAAYGDSPFGRGCLVARRLAEQDVRYVEVTLDGWDTHNDNFKRTPVLMEKLDMGLSSLIRELEARHLLASTLILCMGEFGRTPKINATEGRDHFPQAWSALIAGGGIRAGVVVGETSPDGMTIAGKPTAVPDLLATAAVQLGLNPHHTELTPAGRPISLTDGGTPIAQLS